MKITKILMAFAILFTLTSALHADATKGQKYYLKFLKRKTGINGAKFTIQHTQDEWKVLFANKAKKFIDEYSKKYPKAKKFLNKEKFKTRYSKHILDFCVEYAKDSGNIPSC